MRLADCSRENNSTTRPHLSVIIPAYNEAARIGQTLDQLLVYLESRPFPFEVLVIDDGSTDGTAEAVELRRDARVSVLSLASNQGKGSAVRRGIERVAGEFILLTDADLSAPIEELERLEPYARSGYAIVCGSRGLPESHIPIRQPFYRETMGKLFNVLIRLLRLSTFHDTQCGFKLMHAREAKEVARRCQIRRFAFDVEMLYIARQLGVRTVEVPITWRHVPESRVHPLWDSLRMLWDVIELRLRTLNAATR